MVEELWKSFMDRAKHVTQEIGDAFNNAPGWTKCCVVVVVVGVPAYAIYSYRKNRAAPRNNLAQNTGVLSEFKRWFVSIPKMSRCWFIASIVGPLVELSGLASHWQLILDYTMTVTKFEIWRPVTALFYYPITPITGFTYAITLLNLYNYSVTLEAGEFLGRPADYLFMLTFNWACITTISLFADIPLLMESMVFSVLYVWCQFNQDRYVMFWSLFPVKAGVLPWLLVMVNMAFSGSLNLPVKELTGIAVGHLYYFLVYDYPKIYGRPSFLRTPNFLYKVFPNADTRMFRGVGAVVQNNRQQNNENTRHVWGAGRRLDE